MISALLILGVIPGAVGFALYPRLISRGLAWLLALGGAAALAAFLAATASFWWLPEDVTVAPASSRLAVAAGIGVLTGVFLIGAFVGLFGGPDPVTPRPLHRIIATATSGIGGFLLSRAAIEFQAGMS